VIQPSLAVRSLLLVCVLLAGCTDAGGDAPEGDTPPVARVDRPAFSPERAFDYLRRQVDFGPRIPGSEGHRQQLAWMRSFLEEKADTVIVQPFTYTTTGGEILQLTNLLARFRPELKERILLVAHWDTRPKANESPSLTDRARPVPGANDGASGTAVLLELANLFAQKPPPVGVDLLLVDGEDYGPTGEDMYLGAKHFARNLPRGYRPLYGVLLDMVGDQDPRFPVEGYSQEMAPEVVQRVWGLAGELGYGDVFVNTPGGYIDDDHLPLNRAGIRTVDVIDFEYGPGNRYWHTPEDVPANTSAESLGIVGDVVAELVYRGG
jgi:glutaminyl-peptide cyclotransferase